ncbi:MAG: serine/threonine-protein kinase [Gemmataceae bacterium]
MPGHTAEEDRLDAVLAWCFEREAAGEVIDLQALCERHPDLADHLRAFFSADQRLRRLTDPLRSSQFSEADTAPRAPEPCSQAGSGEVLGDYEVLEELGRGGMAVVYRARQRSTGRDVALKLLAGEGTEVERFTREVEATAQLDHPHVISIYEVGQQESRHFFSMRLMEGGTLAALLRDGPIEPRRLASLLEKVARGVHHAHQRGILHRDLKPGNVLLDSTGEPCVADFGLARSLEGDASLTHTGVILGTPAYLAPEQARAGRHVSTAADIYGLGAILYEGLAGRPPHVGQSKLEVVLAALHDEPVLPRALQPGVDRDLETVCLKCLEREPERRYESAAALADDLGRWLRGEPVAARPVGRTERAWRWAKRHPLPAILLSILVLLTLGAGTTITLLWRNAVASAEQARQNAAQADQRTRTAREALKSYTAAAAQLFRSPDQATPEEREALARGLELYIQVLAEGSDTPDEEDEAAYSTLRLANGMKGIKETTAAERACRRAVETLQRLNESYPDRSKFAHHLAEGSIQLAGVLWESGRDDEGIEFARQAVRVAEQLAERRSEVAEYVGMCAAIQGALGIQLVRRGEIIPGERLLQAAVDGCQKALRRQPEHWPRYSYLATVVIRHANAVFAHHCDLDRYRAALQPLVTMIEDTVRDRPTDWPRLLEFPLKKGLLASGLLWARGAKNDARRFHGRVTELTGEIARRKPADPVAAHDHAMALFELGLITENDSEAVGRFRAAFQAIEPTADRPSTPASLMFRAHLLAYCPSPAVRNPQLALALARQAVAADPGLSGVWETLADCLCETGAYPEAITTLNRQQPGRGDRWTEDQCGLLHHAQWLASTGDRAAACKRLQQAEPLFRQLEESSLRSQSFRDRVWRQVTGSPPPPLWPASREK